GQPDVSRRYRLWADCGWRCGDDGKLHPTPRRGVWPAHFGLSIRPPREEIDVLYWCSDRSCPTDSLWCVNYCRCLSANLHAPGTRRENVSSHGDHRLFGYSWLPDSVADSDSSPVFVRAPAGRGDPSRNLVRAGATSLSRDSHRCHGSPQTH